MGASEMGGAMLASTLTTCVVFLPLVFMQSTSGSLFQSLALVVVFCQGCSLLVGFTVVPVLAARMLQGASPRQRPGRQAAAPRRPPAPASPPGSSAGTAGCSAGRWAAGAGCSP